MLSISHQNARKPIARYCARHATAGSAQRLEEEGQWWTGGPLTTKPARSDERAGLVLLGGGAAVRYVAPAVCAGDVSQP